MKTKLSIIALLGLFLLVGCSKEEESNNDDKDPFIDEKIENLACPPVAVSGKKDDIIGKWKMVVSYKYDNYVVEEITDYSCEEIIYEFREDSLLVSSNMNWQMNGLYSYKFTKYDDSDDGIADMSPTFEVNSDDMQGSGACTVLKLSLIHI